MVSTIRSLSALLLSAALLLAGGGLQTTLLALRATDEGFPAWAVGLLLSAYSTGFIVGCLKAPVLVARVGHIRVFTAFAAVTAAAALFYVLSVHWVVWMVLRAINGFCLAGLTMVIESWMNDRAENSNRGRMLAVYRVVDLSSVTAGQLMLIAGDPRSFELFALISISVSLAVVPVALTRAAAPAPIRAVRLDLRGLYRVSPLSVVTVAGLGLANGAFWALGPAYAAQRGLESDAVGWYMTATIVGGALMQYPIGYLSDRIDRRSVLIGVTALALAASLAAFSAPPALYWMMAANFCFGAFAFPMYGLAIAHANDSAVEGNFVQISSGLLLSYSAGAIFGPVLAGALMGAYGPSVLYLQTAAIQAMLFAFGLYRTTRRRSTPVAEQAEFVNVPKTSPVVFEIDPRAGPEERGGEPDEPDDTAAAHKVIEALS